MSDKVKAIPDGYQAAIPYLCCKDAANAIEFYKRAFGATEVMRLDAPNGKVAHAEIKIGEAVIMIGDEYPEMNFRSPQSYGGSPVTLHLYVENVDSSFNQAVGAGAKALGTVQDMFYGDRAGKLEDPFGHIWYLATHKEDVSPEEIRKRAAVLFSSHAKEAGQMKDA